MIQPHNAGKKQLNLTQKELKYIYELVFKDGTNPKFEKRLLVKILSSKKRKEYKNGKRIRNIKIKRNARKSKYTIYIY